MEHLHPSGVYMIRNKLNGKKYIGSSVNLKYRLFQHKWYLNKGNHQNPKLQKAWDRFKQRCFEFKVLFYCAEKDLLFFEQRCLDKFKKLYNICKCANDTFGRECSSETKKKISDSLKIYNAENKRKGTPHTEATKRKLSKLRKEFYKTEAGDKARQAVIASNKKRECAAFAQKRTAAIREFYNDPIRSSAARKKISESSKLRYYENCK